jgi:nitrogen fixation/metabolism regulation signal transduction histidine kinase
MPQIRRAKKSSDHGGALPGRFERHLLFSVLLAGAPGIALSSLLLWTGPFSLDHKIEGTLFPILLWIGLAMSARDYVINSLRVLSNVLAALKEEDFSFRTTKSVPGDALGDLALEINNLSRGLAEERLGAVETANLLRKVMAETGTIIFAFSQDNRLRIVNRAGAHFLGKLEENILHRTAHELGIQDLVEGPVWEVVSRTDSGAEKRWIVRRANFRQRGKPHRLIVLAEASEALRAEERMAWHRIIRVLSHEINNSLAPIRSIARTLGRMAAGAELPMPIAEYLPQGLTVIHERADSLNRFLQSYTLVAKVPKPARRTAALPGLIAHATTLEPRLAVKVIPGPDVDIHVDPDQLEQALINLIKNAADAVLLVPGGAMSPEAVTIWWTAHSTDVEIIIRDEGIGLSDTDNLFVPFYTTKETGSGIGLLLSRQIIEAHDGTLILRNRTDRSGCEVVAKLPACINKSIEQGRLYPDHES